MIVIGSDGIKKFIEYILPFLAVGFGLSFIPGLIGWFINWVFSLLNMV